MPDVVDPVIRVDAFVDLLSIKSNAGEPKGFVLLEACIFLLVYSGLSELRPGPSSGAVVKDLS